MRPREDPATESAVTALLNLASGSPECCYAIADCGGILPLVSILGAPNSTTAPEQAALTILNIARQVPTTQVHSCVKCAWKALAIVGLL